MLHLNIKVNPSKNTAVRKKFNFYAKVYVFMYSVPKLTFKCIFETLIQKRFYELRLFEKYAKKENQSKTLCISWYK